MQEPLAPRRDPPRGTKHPEAGHLTHAVSPSSTLPGRVPTPLALAGGEVAARLRGELAPARQAAWSFALSVWTHALEEAQLSGSAPGEVPLVASTDHVGRAVGLSQSAARSAAARLRAASILRPGRRLWLSGESLTPRVGLDLDWPAVLRAVEGDGVALAVCWAIASMPLACAGEWVEVSLPEIREESGYGETAVRRARTVLEERGLLQARRAEGGVSSYRFTARARGVVEAPAPPVATRAPAAVPDVQPVASPERKTVVYGSTPIQMPADTPAEVIVLDSGTRRVLMGALVVETAPDGTRQAWLDGIRLPG